jgi:hypothetical protein
MNLPLPELVELSAAVIATAVILNLVFRFIALILKTKENKVTDGTCPCSTCHDIVVDMSARLTNIERNEDELFQRVNDAPERIVAILKDTKGLLD